MAKKRESTMPGSDHGNPLRKETIGYEAHGSAWSMSRLRVTSVPAISSRWG